MRVLPSIVHTSTAAVLTAATLTVAALSVAALSVGVLTAAPAGAQSLGDVARQEAERRKNVKAPGKTYTNDQLKVDPRDAARPPLPQAPPGAPDTATDTPAPPPGAPAPDAPGQAGASGDASSNAPTDPAKDEKKWRERMQSTRDALARAETFAEALQSRINGLSADFTARDDPAQRAAVAAQRQKALDDLARTQKEIAQHKKALSDIQDEGRKAGVPAGWLR